ncbi:MAG TPA: hypothetical protein VHQ65_07340 [Thermoanaerobaculia bacterium]|nr:hypothetical protein [Thermoanaerobaculia bacterium]
MDQIPTTPIACSLSESHLRERRDGPLAALVALADQRQWMESGARLRFLSDREVLALLHQVVDAERQCCRFLRFRVTYEPDLGPLELEITGPPGTRDFLETILGGA